MTELPINLEVLEIIGYADVLPDGKGPAIPPPIFRFKTDPDHCLLPPYKLAGNWVIEPHCVSFKEARELSFSGRVTLFEKHSYQAIRDHQFWLDEDGGVHYQPISAAKGAQIKLCHRHLEIAIEALGRGQIDRAERHAGTAMAANDRALEPRVMIGACHALKGETKQLIFMRKAAEKWGYEEKSFAALLEKYLELICNDTWEAIAPAAERALESCSAIDAKAWISFKMDKDEYTKVRPLLHQFYRYDDDMAVIVACTGVEASLMLARSLVDAAWEDAVPYLKNAENPRQVFAVAGETMVNDSVRMASKFDLPPERVRSLGQMVRDQVCRLNSSASTSGHTVRLPKRVRAFA